MSHVTLLTGPERRRRWSKEDQCRILAAAFAPGSTVAAVARQYDLATSLIYKWRRTMRARETGFAEVVVVPDEPVATSRPATPAAVIELEIAGKMRLRVPLTTPPTLAAAIVKALGVS
ncbi:MULTISPECIES: transposase [unclassified Mesorhizobium]|uniref:IS66-like element accessory protein TnpA n=1 Tax=unclassified Mesorhizobium TaxID=325217 RepID=UPI000FCBBFBB|nr:MULTISPECIES: transposase [unclassified Mesorhizobium]RUV16806.1 transposase [Mesorhizobium sp. M1A.F.Ca.IN.022.04.1.1]RWG25743.1 MAG: transposase [Mesorhizobium sp.]TIS17100.1 MAG: transposase [Mesorhizobium sp.]